MEHDKFDFLRDLTLCIYNNDCRYSYSLEAATEMTNIAKKHNEEALLVYLMQFNYEDYVTPRDLMEALINNCK